MIDTTVWAGFVVLVLLLMALDLGVLNRKAHIPSAKEALYATFAWVSLGLLFGIFTLCRLFL